MAGNYPAIFFILNSSKKKSLTRTYLVLISVHQQTAIPAGLFLDEGFFMSPFGIKPTDRVALLIDGPSFYHTTRELGWDVDYKKMRSHFDENSNLYRAIYFNAILEDDVHNPVVRLVDWLSYNEYRLVTKPMREFNEGGSIKRKGSVVPEMSVEIMETVQFADHLIIFSADGDLSYAVEAAQRKGAKVTIVSSLNAGAPVSGDLRRVADKFIDLDTDAVKAVLFKREIQTREPVFHRVGAR